MKSVFALKKHSLAHAGFRGALPHLFAALFLLCLPASASAQTLGDVMCNAAFNIKPYVWLFNGIAYITGAWFIGHGLFLLARHYGGEHRETRLHNPFMHLIGGTALLAFPSFINFMLNTLGLIGPGGGGMPVCGGLVAFTGLGLGLDQLMINLVGNIRDPLTVLVSIVAIVIGVIMIFNGLVKASRFGYDPRGNSMSKILANLIVGAILVVVGQGLNTMLTTLFGSSYIAASSDVLSWNFFSLLAPGPYTAQFQMAVMAALTFIQLIGMIAFVRGWIIVKEAAEGGQAKMVQGFTHIVGGVCAINIFYFLELMDSTFGSGFL